MSSRISRFRISGIESVWRFDLTNLNELLLAESYLVTELLAYGGIRMVEAVLLDIDGTLIDNNLLHVQAWQRAFRSVGVEVAAKDVLYKIGMGSDRLVPAVLGDDDPRENEVREAHGREYTEKGLIDHAELLPGARELLQALKNIGVYTALASSAKAEEVDHYLQMLGTTRDAVDALVTSADVSSTKPSGDVFASAMQKLGNPSSAIAIGDTVWDIEAAGRLNIPCACVLSGGIERELLEKSGVKGIWGSVGDMLDDLQSLLE